jgi:hypothetical protein
MMRHAMIPALLVALTATLPSEAAVWNVPAAVPTITGAAALAADGDTILVACGTYLEHDIALLTGVTLRSETGQPDCVTIDAQGQGRVLFSEDATGDIVVEGITLTGGMVAGSDPWTGWGGGALFLSGSPTMRRCRFTQNSATGGGGLVFSGHGSPAAVDSRFDGNVADGGGGVLCWVTTATLDGCTFDGNTAWTAGGGVSATLATVSIGTSTFHANAAPDGAALAGDLESVYALDASILAFSPSGNAVWCDSTSVATAACCDVFGNAGGDWTGALAGQDGAAGNFAANPLFCDAAGGEFTLSPASPCLPGQHPDGASCGTIGAYGAGNCGAPSAVPAPSAATRALLARPNPFRARTDIAFDPGVRPGTRLTIHDVRGRLVRALALRGPGGTVAWDGRDDTGTPVPAGVYFVRATASREALRLVHLR